MVRSGRLVPFSVIIENPYLRSPKTSRLGLGIEDKILPFLKNVLRKHDWIAVRRGRRKFCRHRDVACTEASTCQDIDRRHCVVSSQ